MVVWLVLFFNLALFNIYYLKNGLIMWEVPVLLPTA